MPVVLPVPFIPFRAFDDDGDPLVGGKFFAFISGTDTPVNTFNDPVGLVLNPIPVILDDAGYANIYLLASLRYKLRLLDAFDVLIWEVDQLGQRIVLTIFAVFDQNNVMWFLSIDNAGQVATTLSLPSDPTTFIWINETDVPFSIQLTGVAMSTWYLYPLITGELFVSSIQPPGQTSIGSPMLTATDGRVYTLSVDLAGQLVATAGMG